jgi:hypothetical protein
MVAVPLTKTFAIMFVVALASACGAGAAQSNATQSGSPIAGPSMSAPTTSPPPPSQLPVSPSPASGNALVKCEDMPDQTYTSDTFRFSIGCPANFSWQTFDPIPGRLFDARTVDDKYLNGHPAGQVEISVVGNSGNSLEDWVASHIGRPNSGDTNHFWDSTSNLADIQIAGRPAIGFDYVLVGPESPVNFHAAAFVLPEGSVLLIDWWALSSDYGPTIASVAQQMIGSVQPFGA